jgi:hypothetical protein
MRHLTVDDNVIIKQNKRVICVGEKFDTARNLFLRVAAGLILIGAAQVPNDHYVRFNGPASAWLRQALDAFETWTLDIKVALQRVSERGNIYAALRLGWRRTGRRSRRSRRSLCNRVPDRT